MTAWFGSVLILICAEFKEVESFSSTVPEVLLHILENNSYNFHATPTQDTGYATNVTIQMYIEGLSSFQAQTMDFHVDIYFQETWVDTRLTHTSGRRILVKDQSIFDKIWHPDLYFANAREARFHDVTANNFLLWVFEDGTVYYDCRISLTVMCMMNLMKYPLDKQRCNIRILSYAYDEEQVRLEWKAELPIDRNTGIKLPDMHLNNITTGVCDGTYAIGTWSCLTAEFFVEREIMHHILQSYLPTSLIVVISWFSFWLDIDAVPGRVSLCITTLLTLATQSSAARLALPQVSYIKAIDVWMGTCLAFVFGVMIEFTIVNYWARRKQAKPNSLLERTTNKIAAGFRRGANRIVSQSNSANGQDSTMMMDSSSPLIMTPMNPKAPNGDVNTGNLLQSVAIWQRQSDSHFTPLEGMEETSLTHRNVKFSVADKTNSSAAYSAMTASEFEAAEDEIDYEDDTNLEERNGGSGMGSAATPLRKGISHKLRNLTLLTLDNSLSLVRAREEISDGRAIWLRCASRSVAIALPSEISSRALTSESEFPGKRYVIYGSTQSGERKVDGLNAEIAGNQEGPEQKDGSKDRPKKQVPLSIKLPPI